MPHKLLISTAPKAEAEKLARALLERRVIACANLIPGAQSFYWWQGEIEAASETVLLMKTSEEQVAKATEAIRELHPYSVPEVIVVPIEGGNPEYLRWVRAETGFGDGPPDGSD